MNTLVQGYMAPANDFQLNCRSRSVFPEENRVLGRNQNLINGDEYPSEGEVSVTSQDEGSCSSPEGELSKEMDHSDAILKFIGIMLMEEEDLENKPCMLHDCLALQATEKSLYDVLNNNNSDQTDSSSDITSFLESSWSDNMRDFESGSEIQYQSTPPPREKKHRYRDDGGDDYRSNKQLANNVVGGESEPLDIFDKVLLCSNSDADLMSDCRKPDENEAKKKWPQRKGSGRGRPRGGKKQGVIKEVVDLRSLLMQCAQAVATFDSRTVNDLLAKIRQHSSPMGDGTERLAHYFAKALEARVAGTGSAAYAAFSNRISAAVVLRGYQTYITACPFKKMSNVLANKTIKKLAHSATTLHIIDFGILYGFQWPCLIQALSERPMGPPKLRITGIDFPQPGFRPAERVADTGDRLARYCQRFGVPFEYNAIAQKWETIKVEELKIDKDELVVVNSLYRLQNVPDETVVVNSPRDAVLKLIKKINPDMFIHGVVNGTYNTPFFVTRFREALFQYSSLFDMYEATLPREDPNRLLFEEEVFGKDAINIIACEGTERLDRPETYKQWQARNVRAGFRQLPLDQQIVRYVKNKVKAEYHQDFSVDEDGKWMLQGWKGRVLHAFSCWKPAHN
ncbi:scarecrow-like protein 33 [Salvia miltiorrhiza]|uniref:scarecrow-like protein 33 n=1 Tax=Salvia miltiorrhiza TaxID=226208 RepID=UPI0025AC626D|nr:scarecrow-like protein 33 [Salvia miltiorrhiza]